MPVLANCDIQLTIDKTAWINDQGDTERITTSWKQQDLKSILHHIFRVVYLFRLNSGRCYNLQRGSGL